MKAISALAFACLFAILPFSGCIGAVGRVASIPESELTSASNNYNWKQTGEQSQDQLGGLIAIHVYQYSVDSSAAPMGDIALVTATDIPILEEEQFLQDQVAQMLAEYDAETTKSGEGTITTKGHSAAWTEYTISAKDQSWEGKMYIASWHCAESGSFVGYLGVALTKGTYGAAGISIGQTDLSTYNDVKGFVSREAVECH